MSGEKKASDGTKSGDKIPGSRWFRAFCSRCGEPMRVQDPTEIHFCSECSPNKPPPAHTGLTYAQRMGLRKTNS